MAGDSASVQERAELLPCPFDGAEACIYGDSSTGYHIECSVVECFLITNLYRTRAEAIAAWNRRTPEPAADTARFEQLLVHSAYDLGPVPADTEREALRWVALGDPLMDQIRQMAIDHAKGRSVQAQYDAIAAEVAALRTTPAPAGPVTTEETE